MRAAVHTAYGPPAVVRIAEVDMPVPKPRDLLVKVHATTVNRTDCAYRAASPFFMRLLTGLTRPRVTVLGSEFAGELEAVGDEVTSFAVGERVFGYHEGPFGAHAEYMIVREDASVAAMPSRTTFEEAAASTEGAHYALAFIRKADIGSEHDVLVNGATGAIGSAAVQLLRSIGARVTAVCGAENMEVVRGLGADTVIDYTAEDFTRHGRTYDVVLDAVGKSTFARCKPILEPGGLYLSSELGPRAQNPLLALATPLLGGKKVLFPIPRHDQQMVRFLRDLIDSGEFRPLIDRHYPLDDIVRAYEYVETGQKTGSVVITIDHTRGPSG